MNGTNPSTANNTNATRTDNGTLTASSHNDAAGSAEVHLCKKMGYLPGPNDGQFTNPMEVAIGPSGNLYVIDILE